MNALRQWGFNILFALDCLVNAVIGGDPRMTLSARMGRDIELGLCRLCRPVCAVLSLIQRDHCARAWSAEQKGADASQQITGD
jgi:hypothetical protein